MRLAVRLGIAIGFAFGVQEKIAPDLRNLAPSRAAASSNGDR